MTQFSRPIKLLLADAQPLFRRGLAALLAREPTLAVAGEADDAALLPEACARLRPDLVLLDVRLPAVLDEALFGQMRLACPQARHVALTDEASPGAVARAFALGMQGYLLKSIDAPDLLDALHRCWAGDTVLSPAITRQLVEALRGADGAAGSEAAMAEAGGGVALSPREQEVLHELAKGASNKQIASRLAIAETTVKVHVNHLMKKLELRSRVQLAVWASSRGATPDQ